MSGTTIVASTLPVSVLCTGTSAPVGIPNYTAEIEGTRGIDAVNGVGITYNVDVVALNEWLGDQLEIGLQVRAITQADLDALAAAEGMYGYELGLEPPGTLAAGGLFGLDPFGLTEREQLDAATRRHREAERNFGELERQRHMLEQQSEALAAERTASEAAVREATEAVDARQAEIQQRLHPQPHQEP